MSLEPWYSAILTGSDREALYDANGRVRQCFITPDGTPVIDEDGFLVHVANVANGPSGLEFDENGELITVRVGRAAELLPDW